ncbi:hypothetical protein MPTK1_1g20510 [Marchantia polymorpha subsp. ruderalis]|uniref:Thioredoxin domain-containing protein n=4 Tax=Marchantia polymorpha TaxID=3197 RepID=A0A176VIA2_MARPO|nr:hypothetical protein AXG93_3818s1310 [Marchantia polymorpha subsp. ruderalis]PTQ50413.1 hypothetical protein MARPO_0001s0387 [Marchantia polymorpha]BBM99331.1 hypothetical protein Mp_1g20510 [Marchantia polymorpha subsp. ruderalis]|eukprot:PTQ50413.1 hypothetical protein MARPO_0001s0387 [Marchantia polymorpha]
MAAAAILPNFIVSGARGPRCQSCENFRASLPVRAEFFSECSPSRSSALRMVATPKLRHNRVQFRMLRYRCAASKPVQVEDSRNEQTDDDEEDDYPMFMEEDDPTWPEGEDDGYGFQVSQFFEKWGKVKVKNVDDDGKIIEDEEGKTDDDDEGDTDLSLKWEQEEYQWIVREINFLEWDLVALQDPTPLIVLGFERYGSSGVDGWALLKELETMIKRIIDSRKYPVRAVKLDVNIEADLAAALKMKTVPTLLFINAGKLVYRMTGVKSADELLQITSHLFYHSTKPSCMADDKTSESVANMQ